jgi:hypothetical protein
VNGRSSDRIGRALTPGWARPMTRETKGRPVAEGGRPFRLEEAALQSLFRSASLPLLTVRLVRAKSRRGAALPPLKHRERGMLRPSHAEQPSRRLFSRDGAIETRTRKGRRPTHRPSHEAEARLRAGCPQTAGTTPASSVEFPRSADRHLRLSKQDENPEGLSPRPMSRFPGGGNETGYPTGLGFPLPTTDRQKPLW